MNTEQPLDLVWGAENIAKVIRRTARQTSHMLASGQLPAKKVGSRWVAERASLERFFAELTGLNEDRVA